MRLTHSAAHGDCPLSPRSTPSLSKKNRTQKPKATTRADGMRRPRMEGQFAASQPTQLCSGRRPVNEASVSVEQARLVRMRLPFQLTAATAAPGLKYGVPERGQALYRLYTKTHKDSPDHTGFKVPALWEANPGIDQERNSSKYNITFSANSFTPHFLDCAHTPSIRTSISHTHPHTKSPRPTTKSYRSTAYSVPGGYVRQHLGPWPPLP